MDSPFFHFAEAACCQGLGTYEKNFATTLIINLPSYGIFNLNGKFIPGNRRECLTEGTRDEKVTPEPLAAKQTRFREYRIEYAKEYAKSRLHTYVCSNCSGDHCEKCMRRHDSEGMLCGLCYQYLENHGIHRGPERERRPEAVRAQPDWNGVCAILACGNEQKNFEATFVFVKEANGMICRACYSYWYDWGKITDRINGKKGKGLVRRPEPSGVCGNHHCAGDNKGRSSWAWDENLDTHICERCHIHKVRHSGALPTFPVNPKLSRASIKGKLTMKTAKARSSDDQTSTHDVNGAPSRADRRAGRRAASIIEQLFHNDSDVEVVQVKKWDSKYASSLCNPMP